MSILLDTHLEPRALPKLKLKRYERSWQEVQGCSDQVKTFWERSIHQLSSKGWHSIASSLLWEMHIWSRSVGGGLTNQIRVKWDQLQMAQEAGQLYEECKLQKELEDLLNKEEHYWWQQSRVSWLKAGDQNMTFFHRIASARTYRNTIKGLLNH